MCFKIFIIILLIVGSIYDWKYLCVPKWLILLGVFDGFLAAIFRVCTSGEQWGSVIGAMVPGVVMLVLARLSKEQVGYGDGLALLGMGGCMGYLEVMYSFWLALLMVFLISAVLVIFKGVKYNVKIPFVPFLAISSILILGGEFLFE